MFYIKIADLKIKINNRYEYVYRLCHDYLIDKPDAIDLEVSATEEQIDQELCDSGIDLSRGYCEGVCIYRNICRELPRKFDAYLLHSALIEYKGKGYAFSAKSGTGKSTHTGLWLKHLDGVTIVNGDKPILECKEDTFIAYGTPWMGKEGYGENTSIPLKGLCFLEQAKENSITQLSPAEAASRIFSQILFPEDEANVSKTLELTDILVSKTPCYLLKCTISEEAVQKSYEALTGKEYIFKN